MTGRTLVLWDIDLTLLDLRRLGGSWYRHALVEVTGREITDLPAFGGRTDRWIAQELLVRVGVPPSDELIDQVHRAAIRIAGERRAEIVERGVVLPGVVEALRALAGRPAVTQSLVTGNLRPIAGLKLGAFGLDRYVDLEIGGYGALSEIRAELVADAVARATAKHGDRLAAVVVGDTPHDVHAALAHGVRAIGVATGRHAADELTAAGAHAVLPNLADTPTVLATILPTS